MRRRGACSKALWRGFESRQGRQYGEALAAFRPGSSVGMSVRLKSGRSAVRSRPWPPPSVQVVGSDAPLDTTRDRTFGPFMRPIYGQVPYWPHGGRSLAMSRRRTSLARFFERVLVRRRLLGMARQPHRERRDRRRAAIAQLLGHIEGPALAVADPPARVVGGGDLPLLEVA
jgi:hypothetical protein